MRVPYAAGLAVAAALPAVVLAGTTTETVTADFDGTTTGLVTVASDAVALDTTDPTLYRHTVSDGSQTDIWYRSRFDGSTWNAQLSKDDVSRYSSIDDCLVFDGGTNQWASDDFETVGGTEFRVGPIESGFMPSLGSGTYLVAPDGAGPGMLLSEIHFLTAGTHDTANAGGGEDYTVTVSYSGVCTDDEFVIAIADDSAEAAAIDTASFRLEPWNDGEPSSSGYCGDDAVTVYGSMVAIDNLQSCPVATITFAYDQETSDDTTYLGGPLAVTLVTTPAEYDAAFAYRGSYRSSGIDGGQASVHKLFYGFAATAEAPDPDDSSTVAYWLQCSNSATPPALSDLDDPGSDGWTAGPGPSGTEICAGTHGYYAVIFRSGFDDSYVMESASLSYEVDADMDGYPASCSTGSGLATLAAGGGTACMADCLDSDSAAYPGAVEIAYDGIDQDCDGGDLDDQDGDGYASVAVTGGTDCDDTDGSIHPDASDNTCDGIDNDCDGTADDEIVFVTWHADNDTDGYGDADDSPWESVIDCAKPATTADPFDDLPADWTSNNSDCDDTDDQIFPGASETPHDGIDQDCNGTDLLDADGDGADGPSDSGADCNDDDAGIGPDADEIPYDQIDQDCDGEDLTDVDGDGYAGAEAGGPDCDDLDPAIHPNAIDEPGDGTDLDCDGDDGLVEGDDGGCGCASSGGSGWPSVLMMAAGLWAARRRRWL